MSLDTVTGTKNPAPGRRPKRAATSRTCMAPDCTTTLTSYNHNDTCYRHSPRKYPRVRGKVTE